jgi:hypothetical protein
MKLVSLETVLTEVKDYKNRKVCDVIEYDMYSATGVRYKAWIGSTEEAYFTMMFVGGYLTLSLQERECHLGMDIQRMACVEPLWNLIDEGQSVPGMQIAIADYMTKYHNKEIDEITFEMAMDVMGWSYVSPSVKLSIDLLH